MDTFSICLLFLTFCSGYVACFEDCQFELVSYGYDDVGYNSSLRARCTIGAQSFDIGSVPGSDPSSGRGITVVSFTSPSCAVEEPTTDVVTFDTHHDSMASQEFIDKVNSVPQNHILLILTGDAFDEQLSNEAKEVLHAIGLPRGEVDYYRSSFVASAVSQGGGVFDPGGAHYSDAGNGPSILNGRAKHIPDNLFGVFAMNAEPNDLDLVVLQTKEISPITECLTHCIATPSCLSFYVNEAAAQPRHHMCTLYGSEPTGAVYRDGGAIYTKSTTILNRDFFINTWRD